MKIEEMYQLHFQDMNQREKSNLVVGVRVMAAGLVKGIWSEGLSALQDLHPPCSHDLNPTHSFFQIIAVHLLFIIQLNTCRNQCYFLLL